MKIEHAVFINYVSLIMTVIISGFIASRWLYDRYKKNKNKDTFVLIDNLGQSSSLFARINGIDIEVSWNEKDQWRWGIPGFACASARGFKDTNEALADAISFYKYDICSGCKARIFHGEYHMKTDRDGNPLCRDCVDYSFQ